MKNLIQKKLVKLILVLSVLCGMIMVDQTAGPADAYAATTQADSESIEERLASLDGVTSVTKINPDLDLDYKQIYQLTFRQPISYDNPDAGTFEQYAVLYYSGDENVTIINTDGYDMVGPSSAYRLQLHYNAENTNIIDIENPFFGQSVPDGLSEDSADLYQYLDSETTAMHFHRIVQSISSILTGKRLWTGGSKGGFITNYQCYFQEKHGYHDADAFLAWVAPLFNSDADSRLTDALYTTIGDEMYGAETGKKYRDMVLQTQLEFVRYRAKLQDRFYKEAIDNDYKFRESFFTSDSKIAAERLWDVSISEFAETEWQYMLDWDSLEEVLNTTDEDSKVNALYDLMVNTVGISCFAYNDGYLPYYVQSAYEMGNYNIDLSYVRAAVAKEKESNDDFPDIALPEELEGSCAFAHLSEAQQSAYHYSSDVYNALYNWAKTTTSNCIMIYGAADPCYFVEFPFSENAYIHHYVGKYQHAVDLSNLTKSERKEIWALLAKWLAPDQDSQPTTESQPSTQPTTESQSASQPTTESSPASQTTTESSPASQTTTESQPASQTASDTQANTAATTTSDTNSTTAASECLVVKGTDRSKNSQTISWSKISGAGSYKVYRAQCGKTAFRCIATVKGTKTVSRSLKTGKNYKYYVVAYSGSKGNGKKLARSCMIHLTARGTKYSNVKKVTLTASQKITAGQLTMAVGRSTKLTAKLTKQNSSKALLPKSHCPNLRYCSSNTSVAKVDSKGKVKAKAKGDAYIYAIAPNGVSARVLIHVHE